jgi:hypothetical protein
MSQKNDFNAIVTLSAAIICLSGAQKAFSGGQTCVQNYINSREFCFKWSQIGDPEEGVDFDADFTSDASKPDIKLLTGDLEWEIYAHAPSSGVITDIGNVTTTDADHYKVKIAKNGGAGARNVGSLILDPNGDYYSVIASGSTITGDVTGDIVVVKDSGGNGGSIEGLTVGDSIAHDEITGEIIADKIISMTVNAKILNNITVGVVEDLADNGDSQV